MYLQPIAICIFFAVAVMVTASNSEDWVEDYPDYAFIDVKRNGGKNLDSLIEFRNRLMNLEQLNNDPSPDYAFIRETKDVRRRPEKNVDPLIGFRHRLLHLKQINEDIDELLDELKEEKPSRDTKVRLLRARIQPKNVDTMLRFG